MRNAHGDIAHRNYVSTGNLPLRKARSEIQPRMDDGHEYSHHHALGHRSKESEHEKDKHELRKSKSFKFRKIIQNVMSAKSSEASPPPSRGPNLSSKSKSSLHDTERSHESTENSRRKYLSQGESSSLLRSRSTHSRPRSEVQRPTPSSTTVTASNGINRHSSSNSNSNRRESPRHPYLNYSRNDSYASSHMSNFSLNKPLPPEPQIGAIPPLKIRKRTRGTRQKFFETGTLPTKPSALDLKHLDDFMEDRGMFERERRHARQGRVTPRDRMPPLAASSNLQAEVITITRNGGPAILFGLNDLVEDTAEERVQSTKETSNKSNFNLYPDPVPETGQENESETEPETEHKQSSSWQRPALPDHVVLKILDAVDTYEDLRNAALLNRGFYKVFKDHSEDLTEKFRRPASVFLLPPSPSSGTQSPPLTSDSFSISDYQYNDDPSTDTVKNEETSTWHETSQNTMASPRDLLGYRPEEAPPARESRSKSPELPSTPGHRFSRDAPSPPPSQLPPPPPPLPLQPDNVSQTPRTKTRSKGRRSVGPSRETKGTPGVGSSLYTIDEVQDSVNATPRHRRGESTAPPLQCSDDSDLEFDETLRELVTAPLPETRSRPRTPVSTETPRETTVTHRYKHPHHHHPHSHHHHHHHHHQQESTPGDHDQHTTDDAPRIPWIIEPEPTSFLDDIERHLSSNHL